MTDQEKELKRAIELEDPILFLGAGFSLGGKTQNGKNIPKGSDLKKDLIVELLKFQPNSQEYSDLIGYSLSEVCDFCESEKSSAHLTDYLVQVFQNSIPSSIHEQVTFFPWKKIYTTNIDDIVEKCYTKIGQPLLVQNFKRRSTLDLKGKIEYIKLHGCVNNPSEGLTFSVKSYLDSMLLTKDYRFNSLSLDMHSDSIIFVGHDFSEFNIDFYLKLYQNSGYQSSKGKLIFINPYPTIIFKSKIKALGATLIEWTAEQFFEFVTSIHNQADKNVFISQVKILNRFGFESFKSVRNRILPITKYESNLYFGYEPTWLDVFDEWDFQNDFINNQVSDFTARLTNQNSGIFSLYGKGLSGKSTYLLRLAIELEKKGFEVWDYRGKYFNYFEFFKWIKLNDDKKYFALVYDDASYNYKDISRLVNLIPSSQHLVVVTTSRLPSHIRSRYNIVDVPHQELYIEPKIYNQFATKIAKKLDEKGYLGALKKYETIQERVKFITGQNDLLNILYEITYGKGFRTRITNGLLPLLKNDTNFRDLLILLSIFEKLDLPFVPKELVSMLFGSDSKNVLINIEDFIKYNSQGDISLRTIFYLQTIQKVANKTKIISLLRNVLICIAPQLNDKQHNAWNQIEAACTKEKILRKRLGLRTADIKDMLYELKVDLSGSYNFYIQLGIAEQMGGEFDKALNHFRQAEVINPGSYMVKNAIGRNFLKQANSLDNLNLAKTIFHEGEVILLNLINKREELQVRAFSTHTYLYEKINFLKKFKIFTPNDELREMFEHLKRLIDKDPEDIMAKQISNYFFDYLRSIKKTSIIKLNYYDLNLLKSMLADSNLDFDDLTDE